MSFKLIREAQLRSKLSTDELKLMETVKDVLGEPSLTALEESFAPSAQDYTTWLDVIIGFAQEEGLNIKRRQDFNDVAHAVLENDPLNPPATMRRHIVNKLWADMKARTHLDKIGSAAQAQEEEEQLNNAVRAMAGEVDDHEFPIDRDSAGEPGTADDMPHAHIDDNGCCSNCGAPVEADDAHEGDECDDHGNCTMCDAILRIGDVKDVGAESDRVGGAEKIGTFSGRQNASTGYPDNFPYGEENEEKGESHMWHAGFLDGYKERKARFHEHSDYMNGFAAGVKAREHHAAHPEENEEASPMTAKMGEQVAPKTKKTLLQHVLTGPRDTINQALKDVETDGENAWKAHQLPSNPHPKKSMAHRAWEKGFKRAVKTHLGIDDKPAVSTSKQRSKK